MLCCIQSPIWYYYNIVYHIIHILGYICIYSVAHPSLTVYFLLSSVHSLSRCLFISQFLFLFRRARATLTEHRERTLHRIAIGTCENSLGRLHTEDQGHLAVFYVLQLFLSLFHILFPVFLFIQHILHISLYMCVCGYVILWICFPYISFFLFRILSLLIAMHLALDYMYKCTWKKRKKMCKKWTSFFPGSLRFGLLVCEF